MVGDHAGLQDRRRRLNRSIPLGVSDYVKATWVGYPAEDIHGPLIPGESIREVTASEARTSDHWQPVPAAKPGKPSTTTEQE